MASPSIGTMVPGGLGTPGRQEAAQPGLSIAAFRSIIESMKLLVVDDHPVLRGGLCALLLQIEKDVILLQAGSAEEGLSLVAQNPDLDIVILDIAMPGMDGLQAIAEFGRLRPDLPVIVLSSSESPKDVRQALAQGALGYIPKSANQHTLLAAVRLVMNGDLYVPPLILDEADSARLPHFRSRESGGKPVLTDRQVVVLRSLSEGRSNKEIAFKLGLSEKTVKAHITAVFKILNVVNRTQAAAAGRENGLI
jgi:two-component system, NarL family, nitrate/nitrite response regulator NarL